TPLACTVCRLVRAAWRLCPGRRQPIGRPLARLGLDDRTLVGRDRRIHPGTRTSGLTLPDSLSSRKNLHIHLEFRVKICQYKLLISFLHYRTLSFGPHSPHEVTSITPNFAYH